MTRNLTIGGFTAFAVAAVGIVVGVVVWGSVVSGQDKSDLDDPNSWTLIRSVVGELDPGEGVARARVYVIARPDQDALSGRTFYQNKIEIENRFGFRRFLWRTSTEFAGSWCEVIDLDRDGSKEFVLVQRGDFVRVVSYSGGEFRFREGTLGGADELVTTDQVDLLDIDRDGRYEFVGREPGARLGEPGERRVKQWTRQRGFQNARRELLEEFYKQVASLKGYGRQ